jgi:hypothetical protein
MIWQFTICRSGLDPLHTPFWVNVMGERRISARVCLYDARRRTTQNIFPLPGFRTGRRSFAMEESP